MSKKLRRIFSSIVLFLLIKLADADSQNQKELAIDNPRQNFSNTSNANVSYIDITKHWV
jgi:hypothetical protein